jgi:hypothetical protein
MAVFRVKQKTYGLMSGVENAAKGVVNTTRDVVGTGVSTVGKVADSGIGSTAGFLGGMGMMGAGMGAGATLGGTIGSVGGPVGSLVGSVLGGVGGAIAAPFLGKAAVNTGGKVLKDVGEAIHT